jgi:hypothetical protein
MPVCRTWRSMWTTGPARSGTGTEPISRSGSATSLPTTVSMSGVPTCTWVSGNVSAIEPEVVSGAGVRHREHPPDPPGRHRQLHHRRRPLVLQRHLGRQRRQAGLDHRGGRRHRARRTAEYAMARCDADPASGGGHLSENPAYAGPTNVSATWCTTPRVPTPPSPARGSRRVGWQNMLGGSVKLAVTTGFSLGVETKITAEIQANYAHTWIGSEEVSDTVSVTLATGQYSWISRSALLKKGHRHLDALRRQPPLDLLSHHHPPSQGRHRRQTRHRATPHQAPPPPTDC